MINVIFDLTVSVYDIISSFMLVVGGISALLAINQWKKSVAVQRAGYIDNLTEKIRSDEDIRDVIYMLDYGDTWYSRAFHGSGELERKIDKTFSCFSYIVYLRKEKILSEKEFKFFYYEVERLLLNEDSRDYLYNLYHFANDKGIPCTFTYLIEYGQKYYPEYFDAEFLDSKTYKYCTNGKAARNGMVYHGYLNF